MMKYVYKITYPNGKIYIGVDLVGKWNGTTYFGSPTGAQIDKDFSWEQAKDMTIRKEVLWHSETATDVEARKVEIELIRKHKSNEPTIGYNLTPKPTSRFK